MNVAMVLVVAEKSYAMVLVDIALHAAVATFVPFCFGVVIDLGLLMIEELLTIGVIASSAEASSAVATSAEDSKLCP